MLGLKTGMWALRARSGGLMVTPVRTAASGDRPDPWNYLWQPGPYPRTPEEREAAAKKYVSWTSKCITNQSVDSLPCLAGVLGLVGRGLRALS